MTFLLLFVTAMFLHADQNLAAPNLTAIANDFQMTPMQKEGIRWPYGDHDAIKNANISIKYIYIQTYIIL